MKPDHNEANNEEFFRVPKAEFIIERHKGESLPKEIGSLVENDKINIPNRMSIPISNDDMQKSGIHNGDFVVIEKSEDYFENEILAVQFDDRVLIRRLFNTKGRLRLECDSPTKPTIIIENKTPGFAILGRVIQVIKEL